MADIPSIDDLLVTWEERLAQGEEVSAAELCKDAPHLLAEVERRIKALKAMRWMDEPGRENVEPTSSEPRMLGRYHLVQQIGEGGFGEVWRAYDPHLDRHVAVKVPRSDRACSEDMDTFLTEAQRVASLKHPGIVPVFDVGQSEGGWFIVSDLIEGTDLAHIIATNRPTPNESARIVACVAESLDYAHQEGFVHRDIKPSNILIDMKGEPHLTDFGIAWSIREGHSARAPFGTLSYMAPEEISTDAKGPNPKADIYSLGVVFYELLTGQLPFDAENPAELSNRIMSEEPAPPQAICHEVPDRLQAICLKCLCKDPDARYPTADDLAKVLRSWLARRRRLVRRMATITVLLGLALAAVVAWNLWPQDAPSLDAAPKVTQQPPAPEPKEPATIPVVPKGSVQFNVMTNNLFVMDETAVAAYYSFDEKDWREAETVRKFGGFLECKVPQSDLLKYKDTGGTIFIRYESEDGQTSKTHTFQFGPAEPGKHFAGRYQPPTELTEELDRIRTEADDVLRLQDVIEEHAPDTEPKK